MKRLVLIAVFFMAGLLFITAPFDSSSRLFQSLWNTGHLFLFACLVWLLITYTALHRLTRYKMLAVCLVFAIVLGGVIEGLQHFVGRSVSISDIWLDALGATLGFLWVQFTLPVEREPLSKSLIFLLALVIFSIGFVPVAQVIKVNLQLEDNLPVIADFETDEPLGDWIKRSIRSFQRDEEIYREGKSSVLIKFKAVEYPDVTLETLHPDWLAYRGLNMSIHNDQAEELKIIIKIYDRLHSKRGYQHNDRFNHGVILKSGWNEISIKLLDVYNAPKNRKMDLSNVMGLSLFLINPKTEKSIHLDNIHLSK